jgi:hypothetical protein
MLRVAKYLERMIDALELSNSVSYKSDKLSLDSIKKKCNELNGLRKTNSKDESILYKIPLLLTEILNNTNTSSPTDQQATTDKPEEVIKILIKFVFKYYEIKKT